MKNSVAIHVWGDFACFTSHHNKPERWSYPVPTPTACAGILKAIHWKPEMDYRVTQIEVLKPIKYYQFTTNERKSSIKHSDPRFPDCSRTQVSNNVLTDVGYVIHAKVIADNPQKHVAMFNRRVKNGQCYHDPCFGKVKYPAYFAMPTDKLRPIVKTMSFGSMPHSITYGCKPLVHPYFPIMQNGVINVPETHDANC